MATTPHSSRNLSRTGIGFNWPQGLKPTSLETRFATAKAVPFHLAFLQNFRHQVFFAFGVERAFERVLPGFFQPRNRRRHQRASIHDDFQFFGLRDADRERGHTPSYRYFFDSRHVLADAGDDNPARVFAEKQVLGMQVVAAQFGTVQVEPRADVARKARFGHRNRQSALGAIVGAVNQPLPDHVDNAV